MQRWIVLLFIVASLSGCAGSEETAAGLATVAVAFAPSSAHDVLLTFAGAWLHTAGSNGTWSRIVENGTSLPLIDESGVVTQVAPGRYDRIRIVFQTVQADGATLTMVATGFDLPVPIELEDNGTTRLVFGIAWQDAIYEAQEGTVFEPILSSFVATRGTQQLVRLATEDIQTGSTKAPVARIEAFDASGLRFFQSDFIAESPEGRVIAGGPNLTFQASSSEAVEKGATLSEYRWDFGDGTQGEGSSVEHTYPLQGGNFTVRLTVIDSNGVQDAITVAIALQPGRLTAQQAAQGTVTGIYPSGCATSSNGHGMASQTFTVSAGATPDGTIAELVRVKARLYALGNPHAGADLDLRVLDPNGASVGTSSQDGTSEAVARSYDPGTAPDGAWTVEIRPCAAVQQDYEVVFESTWIGKAEPGFQAFLAGYDDGHEHSH